MPIETDHDSRRCGGGVRTGELQFEKVVERRATKAGG